MKQKRFLGFLPALCLVAASAFAQSENTLRLSPDPAVGEFGTVVNVNLMLDTTDDVQGVVAVFEWAGSDLTGEALTPAIGAGEALEGADTIVTRVEANFMIIGVVMDSNPDDGAEIIPPGLHRLATADLRCGTGPVESSTDINFVDNTHATVDGGPTLDNIVVVGGLSIGEIEGLNLDGTTVRCIPQPDSLTIEDGSNDTGSSCGNVRILLTNNAEVEGFVLAICHDPAPLLLDSISIGEAAAAADFAAFEIVPDRGGTFGVVMDLEDPMAMPPNIEPGADQHIATYRYCCLDLTSEVQTYDLRFCDNELGDPVKENIIVVGGRSIGEGEGLQLRNGQFSCQGVPPREICDNGIDDNNNGLIDCDDPECFSDPVCLGTAFLCGGRDLSVDDNDNGIPDVSGSRGEEVEVCFYINNPEDNAVGHAQFDHIQGFSMSVSFCCDLACTEEFDISGTILEALGAEFVSIQCDNDPNDGDGCELIIGVLVDALPPFDGKTIPPGPAPQRMGCVTFQIADDAECDAKCAIEFVDGLNGRGRVPIKNLISAENHSFRPGLAPCEVCVKEQERFHRGDCNFSLMGNMAVDIADAAAVVSFLFLPGSWQFQPGCLDACDCNDDGRIDLADAICILQYLFQFGRFPPAPGPGLDPDTGESTPPGPDPTPDKLDCVLGSACVLVPH